MKIIIQAGGKGTRLEGLTANRPKCLVPVDNLPIIFHIFQKYKDAEFYIIADYKSEVLEKYLSVFANEYKWNIVKAKNPGTISGIRDVLKNFDNDESVIIIWCDLILSKDFELPNKKGYYIGISKDFECRWSYNDKKLVKVPSSKDGVAGLFIFENKQCLSEIEESGALVEWLQKQNIVFDELPLNGTKEIGTIVAYEKNNDYSYRCRPFNSIDFKNGIVTKRGITEQGKKIAIDEINWYKFVKEKGYKNIPEIYEYEPLKMKQVQGKNIFEYDCLTQIQKGTILKNVIAALKDLHNLTPPIKDTKLAKKEAIKNYITKTFDRLNKITSLVPFANDEFIKINGKQYKNVMFYKDDYIKIIKSILPEELRLIHGDCTFSNIMFDTFNLKTVLIDPRGYFGDTKLYGDVYYDWAKLYYSIVGNYDQFNRKKFILNINDNSVDFSIMSNNWEDMEEFFFENIENCDIRKIKIIHSLIWLSLTTYAWEDYDSICGAFYKGIIEAGEVL